MIRVIIGIVFVFLMGNGCPNANSNPNALVDNPNPNASDKVITSNETGKELSSADTACLAACAPCEQDAEQMKACLSACESDGVSATTSIVSACQRANRPAVENLFPEECSKASKGNPLNGMEVMYGCVHTDSTRRWQFQTLTNGVCDSEKVIPVPPFSDPIPPGFNRNDPFVKIDVGLIGGPEDDQANANIIVRTDTPQNYFVEAHVLKDNGDISDPKALAKKKLFCLSSGEVALPYRVFPNDCASAKVGAPFVGLEARQGKISIVDGVWTFTYGDPDSPGQVKRIPLYKDFGVIGVARANQEDEIRLAVDITKSGFVVEAHFGVVAKLTDFNDFNNYVHCVSKPIRLNG